MTVQIHATKDRDIAQLIHDGYQIIGIVRWEFSIEYILHKS